MSSPLDWSDPNIVIEVPDSSIPVIDVPSPNGVEVLVVQGKDGAGVNLAGAVAEYGDLPDDLGVGDAGAAYVVQDNGKLYVWSGTEWPSEGAGADFRGEPGRGVADISVAGESLDFLMSDSSHEVVVVPSIAASAASAVAAAASASAAAGSAAAAWSDAGDAVAAAAAALVSESNASGSAAAASGSALAAGEAESEAALSAGSAAESEVAAAASELAAGLSESAADLSAQAAASAEAEAALSAVAADDSATAAGASELAAAASASSASGSASAASSSASAASDSEVAAGMSELAAEAFDESAGVSAGNASASASAANTSAVNAAASESNAATSASAAAASESNAGSSETSAGNSADDAADSAAAAAQSAQDAQDAVNDGVANATDTVKGGIRIPGGVPGELGGTWDHPVVAGWDGKADLVGGKIVASQLPAIATTETFVVASTAARLALDVQRGDVAVQTGNPGRGNYILQGDDPSEVDDWTMLIVDQSVSSVNGYTGIVVLGKGDVGLPLADNTADAAKPVSTAQQTALDGKADVVHTHSADDVVSGVLAIGRIPTGTSGSTVPFGNDARFTNERTPSDGSVTDAKVAAGAGIALSKLATGNVAGSNNGVAADLTLWVGTAAQFDEVSPKLSTVVYVVLP